MTEIDVPFTFVAIANVHFFSGLKVIPLHKTFERKSAIAESDFHLCFHSIRNWQEVASERFLRIDIYELHVFNRRGGRLGVLANS